MLKRQIVSVTDLRTKTKQCLQDLAQGHKYVFFNNQPIAVLMSVDEYEILQSPDLVELSVSEVDSALLDKAKHALTTPKDELLDL